MGLKFLQLSVFFFLALTYIQLRLGVCRGVRGVGQVFTHTQKKKKEPPTLHPLLAQHKDDTPGTRCALNTHIHTDTHRDTHTNLDNMWS